MCRCWQRVCASLLRGFREFGRRLPPWHDRSQRFGDSKPGSQSVLVEAIAGPCAAEPGVALALNLVEALLRGKGSGVVLRMLDPVFAEGQCRIGLDRRVEAD